MEDTTTTTTTTTSAQQQAAAATTATTATTGVDADAKVQATKGQGQGQGQGPQVEQHGNVIVGLDGKVKKRRGRPPGSKTKKRHHGGGTLYSNLAQLGGTSGHGGRPLLASGGGNSGLRDGQSQKQRARNGLELAALDLLACLQPKEVGKPFESLGDACERLYPYHVVYEENFPDAKGEEAGGSDKSERERAGPAPKPEGVAGGNEKGDLSEFEELSFYNKWRTYLDYKCASMCNRMMLLEERFMNCVKETVTEQLLDNWQLEYMNLTEAIAERRRERERNASMPGVAKDMR
ncbi:hypothetical protein A3770_13p70900 [Chloropicon primus]|uniref:GLTSCR protein conserved domain-containing protein n=1 Tax=Chloropicon primus TaxID=1764295 RepID=A0A5B8MY99_9CHLO|nr:hypothetical protein A3770_13p70900 [Chloropicon primus]|eukprot:QDZ24572.1 hypothetical protein A3770_13p70900 [Chloropicon primus]